MFAIFNRRVMLIIVCAPLLVPLALAAELHERCTTKGAS